MADLSYEDLVKGFKNAYAAKDMEAAKAFAYAMDKFPNKPEGEAPENIYENRPGASIKSRLRDAERFLLGRSKDIDYTMDVESPKMRSIFSILDNDQERESYLTSQFGDEGWFRDDDGRFIITPSALEAKGIPHNNKPIPFDKPPSIGTAVTKGDFYDLAGDLPEGLGAAGYGTMGSGMGFFPGLGMTALGAGLGKAGEEIVESATGLQRESPGEVAKGIERAGLEGAAGEAFFRAILRPSVRFAAGPEAHRMTPAREQAMNEALDMGIRPRSTQITSAPLMSRVQVMLKSIFGDINEKHNAQMLRQEISRIAKTSGNSIPRYDLGKLIKSDIKAARKALSHESGLRYAAVDDLTGGAPFLPTRELKLQAQQLIDDIPMTPGVERVERKILDLNGGTEVTRSIQPGNPVLHDPKVVTSLKQIMQLPDTMTTSEINAIRQTLWDMAEEKTLTPNIAQGQAYKLYKSTNNILDDADRLLGRLDIDPVNHKKAIDLLKNNRDWYKGQIEKFDNNLISRMTMDPKYAGSIDPEMVISKIWKEGNITPIKSIMRVIPEETKNKLRRTAMNDLLKKTVVRGDDIFEPAFNRKFIEVLDDYGIDTLNAMFGNQRTKELYRLARVINLVSHKEKMSSGLVAANLALHPLKNLKKLTQLRILSSILNSKAGLRYFTTGFANPESKAGKAALEAIAIMGRLGTQGVNFADYENE